MKNKQILFYQFLKSIFLLISDALSFCISLLLALKIRSIIPTIFNMLEFPYFSKHIYATFELFIIFSILVIVFVMNYLYQKRRTFWEELLVIWKALFIAFLLSSLFLFNFNILGFISRTVLFILFVVMMMILPVIRYFVVSMLHKIHCWQRPILLACSREHLQKALHIARVFEKDIYLGFIPVAIYCKDDINDQSLLDNLSLPVFKNQSELPRECSVFVVLEIMDYQHPLILELYSVFQKIFVIPVSALGLIDSGMQYLFSERIFIITLENKLNSLLAKLLKNMMDYLLGLIIFILSSPLFLIIMIAVKLTSKGPIFYFQERIGRNGKLFKIWKFRSMHANADKQLKDLLAQNPDLKKQWDTNLKLDNDPRITSIGHFLRKYSLDELPQLCNVLLGEMSLVGPRPFLKGEIEAINPAFLSLYEQVKPGLTGLWQISGRNETNKHERLQIDVWYLQNWSPSLDFLIFLNTPLVVITARGAR
ncbi:MAG: exopolysaccharide biosynthesis polyprenyl glycosylphosphotransferase [Brevinema sp.]